MGKVINEIGNKYGKLTVIERYIDKNCSKAKWLCKCECGNTTIVLGKSLRNGNTRSCGCLKHTTHSTDLTGLIFGHLKVLERDLFYLNKHPELKHGGSYWKCQCDCGAIVSIRNDSLLNGHAQSCGCIKSHGETKISKILTDNNINFQREYVDKHFTLSTGGYPRFDFAILDSNDRILYFIEYQGQQHFYPAGWIYNEEKVNNIQQRDKEKKEYCDNNNIPIIYIPYTKYNTLTINDLLLAAE